MAQGSSINSSITLEGSSSLVVQFFECGLNSILMLRGLYPEDDFKMTTKYGIKVYSSNNPELTAYIEKIISQLKIWLTTNTVSKFVIVISSAETLEVVERWHFDIQVNGENGLPMAENVPPAEAEIIKRRTVLQIQTVLRQISSSVSYLPSLEGDEYTFKVLVYADRDVEVPALWADSGPSLIAGGGEHVRLKSISTLVHNVDSFVAYKMNDSF
ncbi:mitotic spindle assembly checkpoint protein MAD2 [Thamnidium elegans]|nr:mitotic spindle assembly checkpoint protein MAD2 [Thamnidium elegans]